MKDESCAWVFGTLTPTKTDTFGSPLRRGWRGRRVRCEFGMRCNLGSRTVGLGKWEEEGRGKGEIFLLLYFETLLGPVFAIPSRGNNIESEFSDDLSSKITRNRFKLELKLFVSFMRHLNLRLFRHACGREMWGQAFHELFSGWLKRRKVWKRFTETLNSSRRRCRLSPGKKCVIPFS